jgi:hypothetical protein
MIIPDTPAAAVELLMLPGLAIMGLSHIVRPDVWTRFFADLATRGTSGVVMRTAMLELWPALLIVTLHPVWSGPGLALTLYGWALMAKACLSLLAPEIALRGLALAGHGARAFLPGGVLLLVLAGLCLWALLA